MSEVAQHRQVIDAVLPIVEEASALALAFQRKLLTVTIKADGSPVSEADQAIESFLFQSIGELFPEDGFEGEESTIKESVSGYTWRADPVDGTIQYLHGQEYSHAKHCGYNELRASSTTNPRAAPCLAESAPSTE